MIAYAYLLIVLYSLNLILVNFINLGVKNISLFNYKNTTQFTANNFFFDIFIKYYTRHNLFSKFSLVIA